MFEALEGQQGCAWRVIAQFFSACPYLFKRVLLEAVDCRIIDYNQPGVMKS